jgi:hypothetical protein
VTALALWLLLVAGLDLVRSRLRFRVRSVVVAAAAGAVLSLLIAVAVSPGGTGWAAWIIATVGIAGWVLGSGVATARFGRVPTLGVPVGITPARAAIGAYASFVAGLLALLLAGSAAGSASFLSAALARSGLGHLPAEQVLLVAAALLLQISTANLIVRLLLDLVGVPASDNEKTLRGGRVLGPMERLLILGLGVGGSLTGAAIVVAAKSLLRFPELRVPRAGDPGYGGASDITEYFLVGSFASWLVALTSVALIALSAG